MVQIPLCKNAAEGWWPLWQVDAAKRRFYLQSFPSAEAAKEQVKQWATEAGWLNDDSLMLWYPENPTWRGATWSGEWPWGAPAVGRVMGAGSGRGQTRGTPVWELYSPSPISSRFTNFTSDNHFPRLFPYVEISRQQWDAEVLPELERMWARNLVFGSEDRRGTVQNIIEELRVSEFPWAGEVIRAAQDWLDGRRPEMVEKNSAPLPLHKRATVNIHDIVPAEYLGDERPCSVSGPDIETQYFEDHVLALDWALDFAFKHENADLEIWAGWRSEPDLNDLVCKAVAAQGVSHNSIVRLQTLGGTYADVVWFVDSSNSAPQLHLCEYGTYSWTFYRDPQLDPNGKSCGFELDSHVKVPRGRIGPGLPVATAALGQTQNLIDQIEMLRDDVKPGLRDRWSEKVGKKLAVWASLLWAIGTEANHRGWIAKVNDKHRFIVHLPPNPGRHDFIQTLFSVPALLGSAGLTGAEVPLATLSFHAFEEVKGRTTRAIVRSDVLKFKVEFWQISREPTVVDDQWFNLHDAQLELQFADFLGQLRASLKTAVANEDWFAILDLAQGLWDMGAELGAATHVRRPDLDEFELYQSGREVEPGEAIPLKKGSVDADLPTVVDVWHKFKAGDAIYHKRVEALVGQTFSDPRLALAAAKEFVQPDHVVEIHAHFRERTENGKLVLRSWRNENDSGWEERVSTISSEELESMTGFPEAPYLGKII